MFCKVCKDAGKKEADYTSHWVRDAPGPNGKVVCPTLLRTECKYCKATGHIIKFCPKLKGKYWDGHNPSNNNNNISTVKVTYKSTPTASQEAQEQKDERRRQERARELCSSPPPAPETVPTPFGKKTNYFRLLKVDEEDDERTTSLIATLKPDYLAIAKSGVEKANREWEKTKETQIQNYQKDLEKNFPTLGEEKTMKIVNAIFPDTKTTTTTTAVKSYCSVANTAMKYERADSPTPSPVSSRPSTPPPAPKKMPRVKEEESSEAEQEEKLCCGGCKRLYEYGCSEECKGTPSLSPTPSPPPPTTTTTSWADMEM